MKNKKTFKKTSLKNIMLKGFKYGKIAGIMWLVSFVILAPVIFIFFGWQALVVYAACKLSGVCPI